MFCPPSILTSTVLMSENMIFEKMQWSFWTISIDYMNLFIPCIKKFIVLSILPSTLLVLINMISKKPIRWQPQLTIWIEFVYLSFRQEVYCPTYTPVDPTSCIDKYDFWKSDAWCTTLRTVHPLHHPHDEGTPQLFHSCGPPLYIMVYEHLFSFWKSIPDNFD